MTTEKAIAIWTFVSKVMSLLFNILSRFVNSFSSKEQASFNFMAATTIHSDFGAQEYHLSHQGSPKLYLIGLNTMSIDVV